MKKYKIPRFLAQIDSVQDVSLPFFKKFIFSIYLLKKING